MRRRMKRTVAKEEVKAERERGEVEWRRGKDAIGPREGRRADQWQWQALGLASSSHLPGPWLAPSVLSLLLGSWAGLSFFNS